MPWHHQICLTQRGPDMPFGVLKLVYDHFKLWIVGYSASNRYVFSVPMYNLLKPLYIRKTHDDVIKWKHFPCYWPFVGGIHRSPVNSPDKGQWHGALMFSLICARMNVWVYNRETGNWDAMAPIMTSPYCDVQTSSNAKHCRSGE